MPLTTTIDDAWLESEAPTTNKSHRSYVKAFVPAGLVYAGLALIAHSAIWLAKKAGWEAGVINSSYVAGMIIASSILLQLLTSTANKRFEDDHAAAGEISNSFRHLSGMYAKYQATELKILAWLVYYFYRGEKANARNQEGAVFELSHLITWLKKMVGESKDDESIKYLSEQAIIQISNSLGGIQRRRTYRILKSRYVVNKLLAYGSVFVWLVVVVSGESSPVLGYSVTLLFTYVYSTVFIYIKRMENGIGYDIGDICPDDSLRSWYGMIEEAGANPLE